MDSVKIEGQAWTKSVHAAMTEAEFVKLYMGDDHSHIYPYLSPKDKEKTLKVAYKALGAKPPQKAEKSATTKPE